MITVLAGEAARRGDGLLLVTLAVAAGLLSIGWSNDAFDARRDAAAGRTDKPIPMGGISRRAPRRECQFLPGRARAHHR
jgi:4-hydroxybenzoate polyprenyltransferase